MARASWSPIAKTVSGSGIAPPPPPRCLDSVRPASLSFGVLVFRLHTVCVRVLVFRLHTVCMPLVRVVGMARYRCGWTRAQEATYFSRRQKSAIDLVFSSHSCSCWFTFHQMLLIGDVYWQDPLSVPVSNVKMAFGIRR